MKTGAGDKPRILVVENEPIAREMLGDFLRMAGYDVVAAHTGEQALLTLVQERGRIDCLFTSVELSGLVDGWMLADEFRITNADLPVVFATGTAAVIRQPESTAFVSHPVLPPRVVEAVKGLTNRNAASAIAHEGPRIVGGTSPLQADEPQRVVVMDEDMKIAVNG